MHGFSGLYSQDQVHCPTYRPTHYSIYKDTFSLYKDAECVKKHAILMPE